MSAKKAWWPELTLPGTLEFERCVLDSSSLYGLELRESTLENCRAHDINFRQADLSGSTFAATGLLNSQLDQATLVKANFCDATRYQINVIRTDIRQASFSKLDALSLPGSPRNLLRD